MHCKRKIDIHWRTGIAKKEMDQILFSDAFLSTVMPFVDFEELRVVFLGQVKFHTQGLVSFIPI